MKTVLGLGTYPIVRPLHGGQRRVAAFLRYYQSLGITYHYAAIVSPHAYQGDAVGVDDIPLVPNSSEYGNLPFLEDYFAGMQAVEDTGTYARLRQLVASLRPDAVQLEQPFMYPFVKRLMSEVPGLKIIYSSQNVEAPLKGEILRNAGVPAARTARVQHSIAAQEAELVERADLIIAVSEHDAAAYRQQLIQGTMVTVPNGVDRPPSGRAEPQSAVLGKLRKPYFFFVGSAYPPNIEGFCDLVAKNGLFMLPPEISIAVCGGVADGIYAHPAYQAYAEGNSWRVQFFNPIGDDDLWALKLHSHCTLLPIESGGGSNLKTAEALSLGKWVIATRKALRGFEHFLTAPGVVVADDSAAFRRAMAEVLRRPPLRLSPEQAAVREALYWDRCFSDSSLRKALAALGIVADANAARRAEAHAGVGRQPAPSDRSDIAGQ
jgi:glycosyltransferase involved in cell wall biosynthesis